MYHAVGGGVDPTADLLSATLDLRASIAGLRFGPPVEAVYQPLDYAWGVHEAWIRRYGAARGRVILVGMNPGPYGMVQTGVPFGDPGFVSSFLGLRGDVGRPPDEHPRRPVLGFASTRGEVSGQRLWGWVAERFGTADRFFSEFFVVNWCPLAFMGPGGRNITPDALPASERAPLTAACDEALGRMIRTLAPRRVVGVGQFAEQCVRRVAGSVPVGRILHPSPASPMANRGWSKTVESELQGMGVL